MKNKFNKVVKSLKLYKTNENFYKNKISENQIANPQKALTFDWTCLTALCMSSLLSSGVILRALMSIIWSKTWSRLSFSAILPGIMLTERKNFGVHVWRQSTKEFMKYSSCWWSSLTYNRSRLKWTKHNQFLKTTRPKVMHTLVCVSEPPATRTPSGWFSSFSSISVFWFFCISQVVGSEGTSFAGEACGLGVSGLLAPVGWISLSFDGSLSFDSFLFGLQTVSVTMPSVFFSMLAAVS